MGVGFVSADWRERRGLREGGGEWEITVVHEVNCWFSGKLFYGWLAKSSRLT